MAPKGFDTLKYGETAQTPSNKKTRVPGLHELIRPHLDSFNAIKATNQGRGPGLLEMAVADLDHQKIKDASGNVLECMLSCFAVLL